MIAPVIIYLAGYVGNMRPLRRHLDHIYPVKTRERLVAQLEYDREVEDRRRELETDAAFARMQDEARGDEPPGEQKSPLAS